MYKQFVKWLKFEQTQILPKVEVLEAYELLLEADTYEPKRAFRWIFVVDGIEKYTLKCTHRPKFSTEGVDKNLTIELYDPIMPSASHKVWEWLHTKEKKEANLKLLDPVGSVVECWRYTKIYPVAADFGVLDYSKSELCTIVLHFSFKKVELL